MAIATTNPANGQVLKTFDPLSDSQIEQKLERAAGAFSKYRKTTFEQRAQWLIKTAEILEAEKDAFARVATTEMGKTFRSAVEEVVKCAWVSRFYAEQAPKFLADELVQTDAQRSFVRYQPLGAVLAVMPWNFPFWQVIRASTPALAAGNVMLLKHASNVPQCALMIEDLYRRAGFPDGVFQTLLIGSDKVDAILNDPRVVAATLTGSEGAGVQVGVGAAKRIKKVVLELGGSDPFIVMPSANMETAVATAVKARTINNGQSCVNAKRFIIASSIADEFERRFVAAMAALRVGDPFDEKTDVGPLATRSGLIDIERDVQKTVDAGARILTGGKALGGAGFFYPPTVMTNIPKNSPGYSEEFFGPVANLFRAKDIDDAIRIANDTRFGLGSSVWTTDDGERDRFISDIQSGMVFINRMVASDPRLPFGGVKWSGYGRELGVHGVREFTDVKTVSIQ